MADKGIDKRLKLTITEVKERQPVGDKGDEPQATIATDLSTVLKEEQGNAH